MQKYQSNEWSQYLQSNATYLGEAFCHGQLFMVSTYPGLVKGKGKVYGEVYEIKNNINEVLHFLDQYEDYRADNEADSLYLRRTIQCQLIDSKEIIKCSTYLYNQPIQGEQLIEDGRFMD